MSIRRELRTILLLLCCCMLPYALTAQCTSNNWCKVYSSGQGFSPGLQDNGWHRVFFAQDPNNPAVGKFFIEAAGNVTKGTQDQVGTIISPWSNSLFSLNTLKNSSGQPVPATSAPWTEVSDCGDTSSSFAPMALPQHLYLKNPITASDTSATFCVGYPRYGCATASAFTLQPNGSIWLDDEVIDYTSVACNDSSGHCSSRGATQITFTFPQSNRGQRQLAGWTPPTGHNANAYAGLACPKTSYGPRLNGTLTTDAPTTRHVVGGATFDSKRGRIWKAWGFQEVYSFQDTWYLCIFQTAYCSTTQIADGWFHVNLSGNTAGPYTSPVGEYPEGYSENDEIYVPDFDVLYEFGGLHMGATDDAWVFCLSTDAMSVAACHSDQNPNNAASFVLNQWLPVCNSSACQGTPSAPIHGRPGYRDGGRMVYDSLHKKVLIFAGRSATQATTANPIVYWTNVAQWDPTTNDYCLSDTSQATTQFPAFSGAHCSLPAMTGPPPLPSTLSYFPDMAWDSKRNLLVVMQDNLYTYDPGQNKWTLTGVPGGPRQPVQPNQQSMAYDSVYDMYLAVTHSNNGFETWELPGSALSAAGNTTPGFLLTTSPISRTVTPGQSATYTITVRPQNGAFNSQVVLACSSGLPSGATCSFSPASVTPGSNPVSTTLTVSLSGSTPNGSYPINVTGTAGSVQHSTAVALMAGAPSFLLSVTPGNATVTPGQATTYTVTVAGQSGFSSAVTLACAAGLPMGASCSFSPASVTPGTNPVTSTLTISTSAASAASLHRLQPSRPLIPLFAFWLFLPGIAVAGVVPVGAEWKRRGLRFLLASGMLLVVLALVACGGGPTTPASGGTNPGTNPGSTGVTAGSYTITIVGTSGSTQQSATAALVVQ
jgi:hypothetical protein